MIGKPTVTPTNTRPPRLLTPTPLPTLSVAQTQPARAPSATTVATVTTNATAPPLATATPTATAARTTQPPAADAATVPVPLTLRVWPALTLREWPRPERDNGLGIHFLPTQYYEDKDLDYGIARMNEMGLRWALVLYGDEIYLERAARKFKAAGITVVWRKFLRAYEPYYGWERDITLLRNLGMPPYMQIYNEPELAEEWDGRPISKTLALENVVQASRDIYNAGGYVGLQFIRLDWLTDALRAIKARQGDAIFGRTFFVPHPYGLNHPPDYEQDLDGVLSFLRFADVFQQEIGFTPPMIAGEGGWKFKAADDRRYPAIDEARHRDFHLAVFNWFLTGKLSNGQNLPDYLLAFCPWLLFGGDAASWVDSFEGTRTMTIGAVKAMSGFTRRFSGDPR
jgi:hypothetical protein